MSENASFDLGAWVGRHQAFALIASKCSAADAECLREIRDNAMYKSLDISWEEFCRRHAGMDYRTADRVIERLEEFGRAFFNMSEIIKIRAEDYRALAASVDANALDLDGEKIPITPENSARVIEAVNRLRARAQQSGAGKPEPFVGLRKRLDQCFAEIDGAARRGLGDERQEALMVIMMEASDRLSEYITNLSL